MAEETKTTERSQLSKKAVDDMTEIEVLRDIAKTHRSMQTLMLFVVVISTTTVLLTLLLS